jgi:hypothetical protein
LQRLPVDFPGGRDDDQADLRVNFLPFQNLIRNPKVFDPPVCVGTDEGLVDFHSPHPGAQGYRTMMGVSPEFVARRLDAEGADVIGANCGGAGLGQMTEVIRLMKASCQRPLIVKPNAGSPQMVEGKEKYAAGPKEFAEHVGSWVGAGARIVSACCGSGPPHVEGMAKRVKGLRRPAPADPRSD